MHTPNVTQFERAIAMGLSGIELASQYDEYELSYARILL
jgi:hypothetical protein